MDRLTIYTLFWLCPGSVHIQSFVFSGIRIIAKMAIPSDKYQEKNLFPDATSKFSLFGKFQVFITGVFFSPIKLN